MPTDPVPQTAVRPVRVEVRATAEQAAVAAALWIAQRARQRPATAPLTLGFSGGRTPMAMLQALARHDLPWHRTHVFQVDERIVSHDDPRRNAHQLTSALGTLLGPRLHLIPTLPRLSDRPDDAAAQLGELAATASAALAEVIGPDGGLDVVHLGLGDDGHTASLVPGDSALEVTADGYTFTGEYQGTRRITLTYGALRRSSNVCWLAPGPAKAPMVTKLLAGDPSIPAGRLSHQPGVLFTDCIPSLAATL